MLPNTGRRNAARSGERYVHVTGAIICEWFFEGLRQKWEALLVFAVKAASSNGQDAVLSRLRWEFDSPRCYQVILLCLQIFDVGGVMPGRSMAGRESLKLAMSVRFAPRQPDLL